MKSLIRFGLGIIFILIGLIGLFLPLIPGIIFIIIGLALLGLKIKGKKYNLFS